MVLAGRNLHQTAPGAGTCRSASSETPARRSTEEGAAGTDKGIRRAALSHRDVNRRSVATIDCSAASPWALLLMAFPWTSWLADQTAVPGYSGSPAVCAAQPSQLAYSRFLCS